MAWSSPMQFQAGNILTEAEMNGPFDVITEDYLNAPCETVTTTAPQGEHGDAVAAAETLHAYSLGISVDLSAITEAMLKADKAVQETTLSTEQVAALLKTIYSAAPVPYAPFVNAPPPADASEWACKHGFDGLFCTLCDAERKRMAACLKLARSMPTTPSAVALPKRRAMTLTGDVPA